MIAEVNGTTLFYESIGSGSPILIMHGGLGLDHTYLRPWLDPLADQYQLIFYDHRGNGRSERPASFEGISHQTWAADADALRAHLGFERITLLGQSYGSFLAQEYALLFPERLDRLILVSATPSLDYPELVVANAQKRGTPEQVAAFLDGMTNQPQTDEEFRTFWNAIFPLYFHRPDAKLMAQADSRMSYSTGAFIHSFGVCIPVYNVTARLHEIGTPTLLISGGDDWIIPWERAQIIHERLPNSEIVVLQESGHFPFIEEQEAFLAIVREWMGRV